MIKSISMTYNETNTKVKYTMFKYISGSFNEVETTLNNLSQDESKTNFVALGFSISNSTVYQLVSYDNVALQSKETTTKPKTSRSRRKPASASKKINDKSE